MTTRLEDDLLRLVCNGDAQGCIERTRGLSEAARAEAAASMAKAFDAAHSRVFAFDKKKSAFLGPMGDTATPHGVLYAAQVALLATTSRIEGLRKYGWRSFPSEESALAVLRDRRPAWLSAWVDLLLEVAPAGWSIVRALVREGLCPKPTSDAYVLGMIRAASTREHAWQIDEERGPRGPLFDRDPELLVDDMWRIFEVEGNRDISLTGAAGFWQKTILGLVAEGRMDRARVLDATLSALARDFAQHKAGFHSRLHQALQPTATELAARAPRYVGLLGSRIPPTVSFAAQALAAIAESEAPLSSRQRPPRVR